MKYLMFVFFLFPLNAQANNALVNKQLAEKYAKDANVIAIRAFGLSGAKLSRYLVNGFTVYIDESIGTKQSFDCTGTAESAGKGLKDVVRKIISKDDASEKQLKFIEDKTPEINGMISNIQNYTLYYCLFKTKG